MRDIAEIEAEIQKIEADERFQAAPAPYQINGPLALIQVSLKAQRAALLWVLEQTEE